MRNDLFRVLALSVPFLVTAACGDRARVSEDPPNFTGSTAPKDVEVGTQKAAVGEVTPDGFPSDQERMVHVLTNLARHAALNECGDWTMEQGANVKKPPFVYTEIGNRGARFTSTHMNDNQCFQHDSCCVLGDTGSGNIDCIAPADCTPGMACQATCEGGTTPEDRYAALGFSTFSGENIALGYPSAKEVWCGWMNSDGHRQNIYADHTQLGVGRFEGPDCGPYWTQAFGNGNVPAIPRIPAASAMYAPPNPTSTLALSFAANYYDPSGAAPKRAVVVVNGQCYDLTREWGYDDNGTYTKSFTTPNALPSGCHSYYFLFVDGDAARWTYPDTGSLMVAVGPDEVCPAPYDPNQLPADCETGTQTCEEGEEQPCYTGPANTAGVGLCRAGYQVCRNGFWSACRDQRLPQTEGCDGLDNDCDGEVDEGNPGGATSCEVPEERGVCRQGQLQCIGGAGVCVSVVNPQVEVCDGLDNDCDGVIDDGFPMLTCGQGECFRMVPSCVDGVTQTCVPGTPEPEVADNRDNDCDGIVDNGIDCRLPDGGFGHVRLCYSYPLTSPDGGTKQIILPCTRGVQTCGADGEWGPCEGEVGPQPEVCDGKDNDCNGTTDDSTELGWERCGVGACTRFMRVCQGGSTVTCTPHSPAPEVCDGRDNSCDGVIDEGCTCRNGRNFACYTGSDDHIGVGICAMGLDTCVDGEWAGCEGEVLPGTEWCDDLDNDCDGEVDEECVEKPAEDAGSATGDGGTSGPGPDPVIPDAGSGGGEEGGGCGCGATRGGAAWWPFGALALLAFALRPRASRGGAVRTPHRSASSCSS